MDWTKELREQLDDATRLVWKAQNALTDAGTITPEIERYIDNLHYRTGVITGIVVRWQLAKDEDRSSDPAPSGENNL